MNLCLVVPSYEGMIASMHPPLGLIAIRSALKRAAEIEVSIRDGVDPSEENACALAREFDGVGIQVHALNVSAALSLGRALVARSCRVMLGGPEVNVSRDLQWAAGAFHLAVKGNFDDPAARQAIRLLRKELTTPAVVTSTAGRMPKIDYSGLDLSPYWARAGQAGRPLRHAPVITHLGCSFRDRTRGGCTFCADTGVTTSVRSPGDLNAELSELRSEFGISAFYCVGENLARGIANRLLRSVDSPAGSSWSFFARAGEIDEPLARRLVDFGVREIRLGAESGDPTLLASTAKGETLESIERAIRILDAEGVTSTASFILGLPGESTLSLRRTVALTGDWSATYRHVRISASIVQPIPGSSLASLAGISPGTGLTPRHQREFLAKFTSVTWDEVLQAGLEIAGRPQAATPETSSVTAPVQIRPVAVPAEIRCA